MTPEDQARQRLMQSLQREQENRQAATLKAQEKESAAPAWRRRLQRTLRGRFTGALILSLIVLGAVGTFVVWFGLNTLDRVNMTDTIKQFCSAESNGKYSAAYQLVSTRVRQTMSESTFETASRQSHLSDCSLAQNGESAQISDNRSTVAVSYFIVTGDTTSVTESTGAMTLVRENGGWRIDHATGVAVSSLRGSAGARAAVGTVTCIPGMTWQNFCQRPAPAARRAACKVPKGSIRRPPQRARSRGHGLPILCL